VYRLLRKNDYFGPVRLVSQTTIDGVVGNILGKLDTKVPQMLGLSEFYDVLMNCYLYWSYAFFRVGFI